MREVLQAMKSRAGPGNEEGGREKRERRKGRRVEKDTVPSLG